MVLASLHAVILGSFAFWVFWVLAVFPSFRLLPIGRTAGALAGAALTVVFQISSPSEAFDAIDLSILGLLFGTMVVGIYLEKADMFSYLGHLLSWKSKGGKDLLCRICLLSAVASALFTNDTCCIVLTGFVLKLCSQKNLPPKPFLIALATSANIGSVVTPIGNPQNLVIAVKSGIPFGKFLLGLMPSMVVGVCLNTALLLSVFWKKLTPVEDSAQSKMWWSSNISFGESKKENVSGSPALQIEEQHVEGDLELNAIHLPSLGAEASRNHLEAGDEDSGDSLTVASHPTQVHDTTLTTQVHDTTLTETPMTVTAVAHRVENDLIATQHEDTPNSRNDSNHRFSPISSIPPSSPGSPQNLSKGQKIKKILWKSAVYFVTLAMLAALLYGLDLSWTAITAAVTLMALDFRDAGPSLEKVSYGLLVFFAGMFITVDGFNKTGIPSTFWEAVEPHARTNSASGIVVLSLVVAILSNVASNVPTVLLLGLRVAQSATQNGANVTRAWLILAWASTIAGNLTLVGSAANLIVSEEAMKAQFFGYELTFFSHFLFGFPSTLLVLGAGLPFIKG